MTETDRFTDRDIADFPAHWGAEFVNATAYDALLARLSAAEQDAKNGWKAFADAVRVVDEQKALVFAAEARVEAWYAAWASHFGEASAQAVRAALAGREEPGQWEVNDRLARIENAINTMWWWLVSTQTGFGTADAGGIENKCLGCDGNPSGGSCAYPDCKLPPPATEGLLGSAGREETR